MSGPGREPVVVIGVGNEFRRDDGAGLAVIEQLRGLVPTGVGLVVSDGEPTRLIEAWTGMALAVVVDAVRAEPAHPGQIHRFVVDRPGADVAGPSSSHGFGLDDAVALALALDRMPGRLIVHAIEAADLTQGTGLTPAVAATVDTVAAAILDDIGSFARRDLGLGSLPSERRASFTWPSWSFRTVRSVRVEGPDETWLSSGCGRLGGPGNPPGENGRGTLRRAERRADAGAAGNARLTAANAAVLLVLLAAEGVTILRVRQLLSPHVFIGVVLIPPVLVKMASTTWRFTRYYTGVPAYRRKGPPPVLLRLLGPVVVILTLVLLFSGVGLLVVSRPWLPLLLKVHKASFVLWFGAMTIHVLGHLGEVFRLAPRDWLSRTRREVTGAGTRQWLIAASLVAGVMLGFLLLGHLGHWPSATPGASQ